MLLVIANVFKSIIISHNSNTENEQQKRLLYKITILKKE